MCEFFQESKETEVIVFKVVARHRKTGRYYSVLTGNKYPDKGEVPVWVSQKNKAFQFFRKDILPGTNKRNDAMIEWGNENTKGRYPKSGGFRGWHVEMVGRTFGFGYVGDAFELLIDAIRRENRKAAPHKLRDSSEYQLATVKVKLTKGILLAKYSGKEVFGGRHMEILEEMRPKHV